MDEIAAVVEDLQAEQAALDAIVAVLADDQWRRATPSPGWTVADQIGHLTYFDGAATTAIVDPGGFKASAATLVGSWERVDELTLHRHLGPAELLAAWRANRRGLAEVAAGLDAGVRIDWYGPSMGARSFVTARLMEVWAHGQDIVDALGASRPPTDRLRSIADLGYRTRHWSYLNRGLPEPAGEVRVELTAPSGQRWAWGPDGSAEVVRGSAFDWCLVVTQRRHVDDTGLTATGPVGRDWLLRAQAFAGPPTEGPRPPHGPARH